MTTFLYQLLVGYWMMAYATSYSLTDAGILKAEICRFYCPDALQCAVNPLTKSHKCLFYQRPGSYFNQFDKLENANLFISRIIGASNGFDDPRRFFPGYFDEHRSPSHLAIKCASMCPRDTQCRINPHTRHIQCFNAALCGLKPCPPKTPKKRKRKTKMTASMVFWGRK